MHSGTLRRDFRQLEWQFGASSLRGLDNMS